MSLRVGKPLLHRRILELVLTCDASGLTQQTRGQPMPMATVEAAWCDSRSTLLNYVRLYLPCNQQPGAQTLGFAFAGR